MKSIIFTITAILISLSGFADLSLDKDQIKTERTGDSIVVTIPIQRDAPPQPLGDLTVTLLDDRYQPLSRVDKKVVLLNGTREEKVALPIAATTPSLDNAKIRIDWMGNTWLKHVSTRIQEQEIQVIGQTTWIAGSQVSLRVIVTRSLDGAPVSNATIVITTSAPGLEPARHAEVDTDELGTASIQFTIDEEALGERTLTVMVSSPIGTNTITSPIRIVPGTKIFLTSDKPVYQPNQLMRIRALAAHQSTGKPLANREIVFEIYDGKGNKVFKKNTPSSEFGIASTDFQLADEVNQGEYRIKAILGDECTEKTVRVYEYVLPKFRVHVKTDRKFYLPGETITGAIDARYFFGKPVAEAIVTITANCFDAGFHDFETVTVRTDAEGKADYQLTIPDKLVGQPLFKGNTIVQLDVRVRDTADHEEQTIHTVHVANDPIQIEAIPESGELAPGVENEIFLVASYPDGSAAKPTLTVDSKFLEQPVSLRCDEHGIASLTIVPSTDITEIVPPSAGTQIQNVMVPPVTKYTLEITAEDNGKTVQVFKELEVKSSFDSILLRVDKGIYTVGELMRIDLLSPGIQRDAAFIDIIKNNQTVLTRTCAFESGRASLELPIDPSLSGSLTLNAYLIRPDGNMVRDTRQVVVLRGDDLQIDITLDKVEYHPGEPAVLALKVSTPSGEPVQAALGLHVVDESVYSLTETEPGLAKVFFAIEKELLQPKVEIHGFELEKVVRLSALDYEKNADLSKALLAKLDLHTDYSLQIETIRQKRNLAKQDLASIRRLLSQQTLPIFDQPVALDEFMLTIEDDPAQLPTLDPWGRPYQVYFENENIQLASLGQDGKISTNDDIKIANYTAAPKIITAGYILAATDPTHQFSKPAAIAGEPDKRDIDKKSSRPVQSLHESSTIDSPNLSDSLWFFQTPQSDVRCYAIPRPEPESTAFRLSRGWKGVAEEGQDLYMDAVPLGMPPEAEQAKQLHFQPNNESRQDTNLFGVDMMDIKLDTGARFDTIGPMDNMDVYYSTNFDSLRLGEIDADTPRALSELPADLPLKLDVPQLSAVAAPLAVNGQVDPSRLKNVLINENEILQKVKEEYGEELRETLALQQDFLATLNKHISETASVSEKKPVRVRRYFPETLFYTPETITDDQGQIALTLPTADSITTWRMSAMANDRQGAIGDATSAIKVFKPFFIDLDLPVALIQNDEVTIPVAVYNYLSEMQSVEVSLVRAPWFDLLEGSFDRKVDVAANEVTSVTYRIQAKQLGQQSVTVYAWSTDDSDAIGRVIEVRPNGEKQSVTFSGPLANTIEQTVTFPDNRIPGADKLFVKIYPGIFSQLVEGLDAILQMPYGCFEQTSSTTYPNILALDYMKLTGTISPAVEMKAREYINLGYQRLLTFEIDGGGFQVFGNPPATRILSAYGLMEFIDMSKVYPVDANVIERTKHWLLGQMNTDGSWDPDEHYAHAEMWSTIQNNKILSTAYIALALNRTLDASNLTTTTRYLLDHADLVDDSYTLSIVCNALLGLDKTNAITKRSVQRLIDLGAIEGEFMYWKSDASMSFARGGHASVETTAWAVLALIEDGRFPAETGKAINWLIGQKDPNGTWGATHGTVLALKALIRSLGQQTQWADASILIHANDQLVNRLTVTPDTSDLYRQIDLTASMNGSSNRVEITLEGEGRLLYQIVGHYYLPWKNVKPASKDPFRIEVEYDRSELRRNDVVTCNITAHNLQPYRAEMIMIDVGIPPGFQIERPALDEYVETGAIAKYSTTARQLLIYLEYLDGKQVLNLQVPMKATLPMVAKAPESTIYEYYNPENKQVSNPQTLRVE